MELQGEVEDTGELAQEFKVFLAKKKEQRQEDENPKQENRPIRRCFKCRCKCPKFQQCDCECTKHPHWKCPKPKEKKRDNEEDPDQKKSPKKSKLVAYCSRLEENLGIQNVLFIQADKTQTKTHKNITRIGT